MSRDWKCHRSRTRIRATAKCSVNWDPTVSTTLRQRAQARQAARLGQRHPRPWRGHDLNPLMLGEHGLLILVNKSFIRCNKAPDIACHPGREGLDVVGTGCQEWVMGDQAAPRDV